MGPRQRKKTAGAVGAAILLALVGTAGADPIWTPPESGRGELAADAEGRTTAALLLDVAGVGVVLASPPATYPELGPIDDVEPELLFARVGLLARSGDGGWLAVVRIDAAEGTRLSTDDVGDRPGAAIGRVLDDAAVWWRPRRWAELVVGRWKVPFSRFRHLDRTLLSPGAVPFVTARIAPDRRWGVGLHGDLGAMSYAAGVYEDLDVLEPRFEAGDPSLDGRVAGAAHLEWTPRAPIGDDHVATTGADPWYDTVRVSGGIGALGRLRGDRSVRTDLAVNGQLQWRRYAAIAELILSQDGGLVALSASGQASVLASESLAVFVRGDADGPRELASAGAGLTWFVTPDRRNRVTAVGFVRRPRGEGAARDALLLILQASL